MLQYSKANTNILVFSKWSRKSYAIFASLHKVVIIAQLSVDICRTSLLKNRAVISLLNWVVNKGEKINDRVPDDLQETQQNLVLLLAVAINNEITHEQGLNINNNKKPIFCTIQNMGFSVLKSKYD